ncbi:MAG TPA: lysylphosphatidylglycerol synthase transmembrane domain-containing protein [Candidatus Kryptonia bacterium]
MLKQFRKKIFISLAIAALIGVAFSLYANTSALKEALSLFDYKMLPIILLFPILNYLIRFVRWEFYLKALGIDIPRSESFGVFFSSLSMSVTPGKMGEVVKSYFLKSLNAVPISRSAPIIFAERITDFLALLIIATFGAYGIGQDKEFIFLCAFFFLVGLYVIANRSLSLGIINFSKRIPLVSKWIKEIEIAYESSRTILSGKSLIISTLLGLLAWYSECIGFLFVLGALGIHLKLLSASFIYSFSIIVGAVSFLPGGIGATETSLAGLLILAKIPKSAAVAATLIVRALTLWFAVIIGAGVLSYMQRHYEIAANDKLEHSGS